VRLSEAFQIEEKYHYFTKGEEICRYGIFGLMREYFKKNEELTPEPKKSVKLEIPKLEKKVLQIVITGRCNLDCQYCSFKNNTPQYIDKAISLELLKSICASFNEQAGDKGLVLITGGEPELFPQAVDLIAENIKCKKMLFTNGVKLKKERLLKLHRNGIDIVFSLDGDILAQDRARKGGGGSFAQVAKSLSLCRDLDIEFGISAVVGDHNIDRLPQLVGYIVNEFHPQSIGLNLPHYFHNTAWMRIEEYTSALISIFQLAKRENLFVDQIARHLEPLIRRNFRFRDCSSQGEKTVVFPDGATSSCVNELRLYGRKIDWEKRIPLHREECWECYAIAICGGGCIFDGESIYGEGQFDERNCYFVRNFLEFLIWELRKEMGEDSGNIEKTLGRYSGLLSRPEGTKLSIGHATV
jgi:radical SAM protein with 4Fe4S-binding SPASM domain